ncbi:unnamed protein product [Aureobasidium vineae]|uniref:LYR motif-containing protein Cup1-like N-terminal domain-containing protein n=1 Tax=Aureobasidium vineae TaxID=2773715 RepID=A0A9N8PE42_9PEZI|nr:unnamed protein product [Aureobasidium vineae]
MPPLFTHQQCSEARHLLRAILREATYLSDHQARIYIATHAVARFRDYTPAHKPDDVLKARRREQLDHARKGLSELRRANQGELKPLLKVLHLTYARIGKRRHEILRDFQYKPPADADPKPDTLPKLSPQHIALLDSQKLASPPNIVRPLLRSWSLKIPETNSWEKPLPKKRIAKIVRDWYADVLERTVVPLPVAEWERLRDLALGQIKFQGPPPRRRMPASGPSFPSALELALGLVQLNSPDIVINNVTKSFHARKITPRSMRRCWATVFAQCPVMSWNAKSEKWSIEWGCNVLNQARIANATDEAGLDKS